MKMYVVVTIWFLAICCTRETPLNNGTHSVEKDNKISEYNVEESNNENQHKIEETAFNTLKMFKQAIDENNPENLTLIISYPLVVECFPNNSEGKVIEDLSMLKSNYNNLFDSETVKKINDIDIANYFNFDNFIETYEGKGFNVPLSYYDVKNDDEFSLIFWFSYENNQFKLSDVFCAG